MKLDYRRSIQVASLLHALLDHPEFCEGTLWRRECVPARQTIFAEGDQGCDIYLIMRGKSRVVGNVDLDERRRMQSGFSVLREGDVFGELTLFDGEPRSAGIITDTECELVVINGELLMDFLDAHPDLAYPIFKELIHIVVGRLRQANRRIFSLFAWGLKVRGIDQHID